MCGGIACSFRKPLETLGHVMYIFPKLLRSDLKMSHRKNKNWGYTRVKQLEPVKTILDLFLLVMLFKAATIGNHHETHHHLGNSRFFHFPTFRRCKFLSHAG